ncbi:hypothetical protein D3C75_909690 [compost metagenome]
MIGERPLGNHSAERLAQPRLGFGQSAANYNQLRVEAVDQIGHPNSEIFADGCEMAQRVLLPLACVPDQFGCAARGESQPWIVIGFLRGVQLPASPAAAAAGFPFGLYGHMAGLSGITACPLVQLSANNNSRTNPRTCTDIEQMAHIARCPEIQLPLCSGISLVVNGHRDCE